jgi:hypothetical protein
MNKILLLVALLLPIYAQAWQNVPTPYPYSNPYSNPYDTPSTRNYQSNTDTSYQYDLSNPSDRLGYSVDPGAQMRDRLSVNPLRSIDRGLGQYGGGIND